MKFEESYLYMALALMNRALEEDDNGIFNANDACALVVPMVSNLGLMSGPMWDERGQSILLSYWGQYRHHFVSPVKEVEEDVVEEDEEEFGAGEKQPTEPTSRRFPTVVKWPTPFNTLVVLHREGETSLYRRYGDLTYADAESAFDYRINQLSGRRTNLDGGYGRLVDSLPEDGKTTVYDVFKGDKATASDILAHIEKTER